MKVLVTGFEPFGADTTNSTIAALSHLPEKIGCVDVEKLILPVSFKDCIFLASEAIDALNPDAIIMTGQAAGRADISIERIAVNLCNATNPDNDGYAPHNLPVIEGAPDAVMCNMDVVRLVEKIKESEIPAHISNTAGLYVCNTLYYSVRLKYPSLPAVFVHLPLLPSQCVNRANTTPSMASTISASALTIIIKQCKESMR